MDEHTADYTPWVKIISNSPSRALEEIQASLGTKGPSSVPFLVNTVDQVYDFFKSHLRPADDSTARKPFTYFTFIVIDAECVESDPWQCILCCDAPDYGEAHEEVKLKQLRMPIAKVMERLCPREMLGQTPSEFANGSTWVLSMIPPPTHFFIYDERGEKVLEDLTPGDSRKKKRGGIEDVDEAYAKHIGAVEAEEESKLDALYATTREAQLCERHEELLSKIN